MQPQPPQAIPATTVKPFARSYALLRDKPGKSNMKRPHAASQPYEPGALCAAYGWPTGIAVQPTTTVILELGGHLYQSDIQAWAQRANMPAPTIVSYNLPGANDSPSDADGEVALDWQRVAESYSFITGLPASILIINGPNSGQAFADIINVCKNLPPEISAKLLYKILSAGSISWGIAEEFWAAIERANMDAAAQACQFPWNAASGDNLSNDGTNHPATDLPASSPWFTGCGGTSRPPTGSETVWNSGNGEGTGGGFSKIYDRPTWQTENRQGSGRMVPDWSAVADPSTAYNTIVNGNWQVIGGTSAVSPLMSGFMSAVNGCRLMAGMPMIAQVNPLLWTMLSGFYDVTQGTNGSYSAERGPDPCTGMGRAMQALFAMLTGASQVPPVLPPTPVQGVPVATMHLPVVKPGGELRIRFKKGIPVDGNYGLYLMPTANDAEVSAE